MANEGQGMATGDNLNLIAPPGNSSSGALLQNPTNQIAAPPAWLQQQARHWLPLKPSEPKNAPTFDLIHRTFAFEHTGRSIKEPD